MSSTSIARQNRRLRHKQLPPLKLSPSVPSNLLEVSTNGEINHQPSTTGCSFVNCDVSSQPIGKVFLEEGRGFKVIDANQLQLINNESLQTSSLTTKTAIIVAYKAAQVFQNFSNFCHGLLGGMSLIHLLLLIHLGISDEALNIYSFLSQPIHNIFNFTCIICCISAFDRYDIGSGKDFLKHLKRYFFSASIIILYPICLLLSFSTINVDEKLWLMPNTNSTGWEVINSKDASNELFYWKILSMLKCAIAVLGWVLLCWNPDHNLFLNHLEAIYERNKN